MGIKMKALGLGLLAALAVGGTSVVSAPADTGGVFHSDSNWTHIAGSQEGALHENVLSSGLGNITCGTANYTANVGGLTATEITVQPTYANCKTTEDGYPITIDINGCAFVLTISDDPATKHHTMHLECPTGKEITFTINPPIVGECTIHIPPQTPTTGGVVYKNVIHPVGGKHNLTIEVTIEGITHTQTEHSFGCGGGGEQHTNAFTFKSTITTVATNTEGAAVNVTATTASS
jgi:hypothetical protein